MWLPLAVLILCFTIVVMFRMYIDLKRQEQNHQRMMRSDQRDYERYVSVTNREVPKAQLPDFDQVATRPQALPPARYYQPGDMPDVLSAAQLEALRRTYAREDYYRFIEQRERSRRTL